jgi:putative ABC transport system ATP-binding protein
MPYTSLTKRKPKMTTFDAPRPAPSREAVRLVSMRKVYGSAANPVIALDGVSLTVPVATFIAVMGPSGSGKTTLLQVSAGLDRPTDGRVFLDGAELTEGSETAVTKFRRQRVGFVFQQFNLLPALTALQNVTLPLRLAGRPVDPLSCAQLLGRLGLGDRLSQRPAELSGGEQQRVAIARALVTNPTAIFADEPTGALDTKSARDVFGLLQEAVRGRGRALLMVTHDPVAAAHADSVVFLADGRIVAGLEHPTVEAVAERLTHLADQDARQDPPAGDA